MIYLSTFLLALFLSMALIPLCARAAERLGIMDVPDARKVHARPIPRTGGLAMALGALIPLVLWAPPSALGQAVLLGGGVVVVFGFADDVWDLGYRVKFVAQFAAALIVVFWGGVRIESLGALLPGDLRLAAWLSVPLTVLAIVGVTNAINLSDGLDGLAGGVSGLGFAATAYLAALSGDAPVAFKAIAVAGATLGFLRFNTHPATVFMGDAGSQFLGFMAITLALSLTQGHGPLSPLVPLLLLGFPVLDTLAVMGERVAKGRPPFAADKNHFHHKLLRLGLYHADAVRVIYLLQALLVVAALLLRFHSEWVILGSYAAFAALVLGGIALAERTGWTLGEYGPWKSGFRDLKEGGRVVRVVFRGLQVGLPGVFLLSALVPSSVPGSYALSAAVLAGLVIGAFAFDPRRAPAVLRLSFFLSVPVLVYLGETSPSAWFAEGLGGSLPRVCAGAFLGLVLLTLLVIRFSRRQRFRSTPLDLLVLAVALAVPMLSRGAPGGGMLAAKMIVFFFGYEVLLAESRGSVLWLGANTLAALAVTAARGLL